ncbi:MAG: hypothetical protein NUV82_04050 [Candidatus Komeilibacteria bacterium]|nr:hypothetical protein [Candidatus Komeilibacteria bacterium]
MSFKHKIIGLLLLTVGVAFFAASAVRTADIPTAPSTAININNDSADQVEFDITDGYIVYTELSDGKYSLYLYNMESGDKEKIAEQYDIFQPSIDDREIVWVDAYHSKRLRLYNINSGESYLLAGHNPWNVDLNPHLEDGLVSFTRWDFYTNGSAIMAYDIVNQKFNGLNNMLTKKQTNQWHVGQTIVWQENVNDHEKIFIYNVADDTRKEDIWTVGQDRYFPKIHNNHLIWDSLNAVYVKNIETEVVKEIRGSNYANYNSDINGDNVIYQSQRNGNTDIYLYNLSGDEEINVSLDAATDKNARFSKEYIAWQREGAGGRNDIVYVKTAPLLEKLYTSISFALQTDKNLRLTWPKLQSDKYDYFILYRSTLPGERGDVAADGLTTNEYLDKTLLDGITYYYTLTLVKGGEEIDAGHQFSFRMPSHWLVKTANSSTVYVLDRDNSYSLINADIFRAHGFEWKDISLVSRSYLDSFRYGGPLSYPSGTLLKGDTPTVYVVDGAEIHPFINAGLFIQAGYAWSDIRHAPATVLQIHTSSHTYTLENFVHPDGTLFKYANSPDIYLLQDGKKRLIGDDETFRRYGFDRDKILVIPTYWTYDSGPNL